MKLSQLIEDMQTVLDHQGDMTVRVHVQTGPDSYKWAVVKGVDTIRVSALGKFIRILFS
jgi:hypothetical protein